jgi:amino acid adenylation domain-containing protein
MSQLVPIDYNPFEEEAKSTTHFATTEEQREIYASIQIGGLNASLAYNECVSIILKGTCNVAALTDACKKVVIRHEALRSSFSDDGMQLSFLPETNLQITQHDFSSLSEKDFEKEFNAITAKEVLTPFDLQQGPVIRFNVVTKNAYETILIITAHHIVCDGWSIGIIMQDISRYYSAFVTNKQPQLENVDSFVNYLERQQSKQQNGEHAATENYWLDLFAKNIPVVDMPVDKSRPAIRTFNAARADIKIPEQIAKEIKQYGAKQGCSYVNTLYAAFEIFLNKITKQQDLIVGLPAAGQSASGMYQLVGHCVNILPIRTTVDEKKTFAAYLKERRKAMFDAFDHQEFTMGSLLGKLPLQRDPGRIPLVPVVFNVDLGLTNGVSFHNLQFDFISHPRNFENFEMFVNATGMGDALNFECTYNSDLFDAAVIDLRLQEFLQLLTSILQTPEAKIYELDVLGSEQKLFAGWNNTHLEFEKEKGVHEIVDAIAKQFPQNIAVDFNNQTITYQQLNEKANLLAQHLLQNGVTENSFVCVCLDRSIEMIVALLAVLKSGAAYVPVDPSFPAERIAYMMSDSKAKSIITQSHIQSNLNLKSGNSILLDNDWVNKIKSDGSIKIPVTNVNQLAYMIYTSGTTGNPKGVQIKHQSFVNLLASFKKDLNFSAADAWLAVTTISFDIAGLELFLPLTTGAKIVIATKNDSLDGNKLAAFFSKKNISTFQATPVTFRILQEANWKPTIDLKILIGGEAVPADVATFLASHCKNVWNVYGPTETTIWSTTYKLPYLNQDSSAIQIPVYIGKPLANTSVYILDDFLTQVPIGVDGDIYIGGEGLSAGYFNNAELTDDKFIYVSINDKEIERIYKTGDKGKFKIDGNIEYSGRTDNQVKIRGYRIETGEIETVMQKNTAVRQCVVIAREDTPGNKRLVAYYSIQPNQQVDVNDLKSLLTTHVPEYMMPSAFMEMENLPLTPNGKIDRKALPKPDLKAEVQDVNYEEPNTPLESLLTGIWCELLHLDKIGINDNFFELGGHSLLGIKMMGEIERKIGVRLDYPTLFRASTIQQLAKIINKEDLNIDFPVIVPFQKSGNKTPLFCIHMHNGNIQRWRVLTKFFGDNQPVYAIQPRGLDPKKTLHTSIEEMSDFYIDEIKKIQPHGPYNLIGLCFGGVVVYEMCRRLQEAGDKINLAALIDSYAPAGSATMNRVYSVASEFLDMSVDKKVDFALEKRKNAGRKVMAKISGKKFDKTSGDISDAPTETATDIRFTHTTALLNYTPKPFSGKVTFIRTGDPNAALYDDNLGWTKLVQGELEVVKVPGSSHDSIIIEEQYYSQLAQIVKERLGV